ncbi:hypothetical protein A9Q99_05540 [Gammaproteobacteria bacterium 45_16_T64]|nr:hypothetical protein A9Q99_05540 [Gammaproteobacteria bacterium 45_16_T64]
MALLLKLCLLVSLLFPAGASAQFVQNITIGNPKALGLAHAVTADPPGIDSIHFNPAGLAKIKGRELSVKLLAAQMTFRTEFGDRHLAKAETTNGESLEDTYKEVWGIDYPDDPFENTTSYSDTPVLMLPFGGLTDVPAIVVPFGGIAIEDPDYGWVFATAVYSPQAMGFKRDEDDPGRYQGQEVGISRITYFSPSIGIQVNDTLSIGASIGFSWQGLGIISGIRAPITTLAFIDATLDNIDAATPGDLSELVSAIGPYDPVGTLSLEMEDALSFSFNLGLLWEATPWISFGLVYQSESTSNLKGDYKMESDTGEWLAMTESLLIANPAIAALNGGYGLHAQEVTKGTVELEYIVPQHFAIGTSVQVFPNLKVNVDLKWTDYAAWESLDFVFSDSIDFLTISDLIYQFGPALSDGDNADPNIMRVKRDYESVWSWAIGTEYQYSDNLVLRAGYEPRTSSIPEERVDLLAPIAGAELYTVGFGYRVDAYTKVDLALGWLHSAFTSGAGESKNLNSTKPGTVVYNPYAYLDVEQETNAYILALSYDTKF